MSRSPKSEAEVWDAITAGKAFLKTFTGRHRVVGMRPSQDCNIVTNNTGSPLDQQGWAAGWWEIQIED